ncbi:MAG: hypothetical protein OQK25_00200, partial [Gammaproteobacteria bacterium]|nr:hypothetical protein [Gammaproteobacteria bacterium]
MDLRHLEVEIEHLKREVQELKQSDREQTDDYTQKLYDIDKKLDKAIGQLDMYRHFTIFIRAILIGIIMIVTIKFGDIKE